MCGIAVVFAYNDNAPRVDRDELLRIRERMVARGPDGAGEWFSADMTVGLGHRRLSIIDLTEAGAQPMATPDENLVIVFNGEIYNYRELRKELENKGCRFRSGSDTEVLLHLYGVKGPEMVHDLRGMYAFAIWDQKNRRLFAARDPFGIKPLYYNDNGKTIRIASQVKALLAGGEIDTAPEPAGHVGFFLLGSVPEPHTLYKGVKALAAGSCLTVGLSGGVRIQTFCRISDELAAADGSQVRGDRREIRESLREALLDSVRHHLIADVPVGVFLSSGLDSTTITALASEIRGGIKTVTLGFDEFVGTENDETPLAEQTANQYGTEHRTIGVGKGDFEGELARLLDSMDQPSIDGVNSYFVCQAAVKRGLKVALSGLGGDELFGGYPSFKEIPRLVGMLRPMSLFPWLGKTFRIVSASFLKQMVSPKFAGIFEYGSSYGGAYLLRRGLYMPWELPKLLDPEMVREGWRELNLLMRLEGTSNGIKSRPLKISALEMSWYMRNQLLRDTDWASMAHSLEVRVPLLDLELLRNFARLTAMNGAITKQDMAATPLEPIPSTVLAKRKSGFSIPVRDWISDNGPGTGERGLRGWLRSVYGRQAAVSL
ncbi:MAG: asparagine synthase (glutamine-hydrolyzing) [Syntrophobacteraceae bacterium]|nr:asparagine synthase (glutamine-hydrolyzing) [Syntrophobacteraceae bacterium]